MYEDDIRKKVDFFTLNEIYNHLEDDISKEIFQARLMYSISNDSRYVRALINTIDDSVIKKLNQVNKDEEIVLFGAGILGKMLLADLDVYNWKYVIDNNPKQEELNGCMVVSAKDFLQNYKDEYIVITSREYYADMEKQLYEYDVPKEKVINLGAVSSRLMVKQYFDLEFLKPAESKEIFIDIGCYDGMTSKYFCEWCADKKNAAIYAFEAQQSNILACRSSLEELEIEYTLVEKGLWSHNTTMAFKIGEHMSSRVDNTGEETVELVSLDQYLQDVKATFIKMDIEGAELEALKGAEQQIRKYKPKLAISVYHKANDIWKIPKLILEYNPEYRFFLRHYTLSQYDTILYAI